jgi:plastocyanin
MKKQILRLTIGVILIALLAACSAPVAGTTPVESKPVEQAASGSIDIQMKSFAFNPKEVTVKAGTKVTWTNMDSAGHDVKAADGSWGSDTLNNGQTYSKVFDKEGTYPYVCTFHSGMAGTIVVTP